jgi:hypothetical protein
VAVARRKPRTIFIFFPRFFGRFEAQKQAALCFWGLVWFGLGLRFLLLLLLLLLRLDRPSVRLLVSPGRAFAGLQ